MHTKEATDHSSTALPSPAAQREALALLLPSLLPSSSRALSLVLLWFTKGYR